MPRLAGIRSHNAVEPARSSRLVRVAVAKEINYLVRKGKIPTVRRRLGGLVEAKCPSSPVTAMPLKLRGRKSVS